MDEYRILLLRRDDLKYEHQDVDVKKLHNIPQLFDIKYNAMVKASFIVFVEDANDYHILKNRYPIDSARTKGILDLLCLNYD